MNIYTDGGVESRGVELLGAHTVTACHMWHQQTHSDEQTASRFHKNNRGRHSVFGKVQAGIFALHMTWVHALCMREIMCNGLPNKITMTACLLRVWSQEQTGDGENTSTPLIMKAGRQLKHFQLSTQHTCRQHRPFQRRIMSFIRLTVAGCPTWCTVGERWQREAGSTSENIKADLLHIYFTWQPGNLNWRRSQDPLLVSQSVKGLQICSYQLANLTEPAW